MNEWDTPGGLVVAGMGGSAIGGALAAAALGDHASRPILVTRAYGLPPWTTPETTVLCASYSGQHRGDARLLRVRRRARCPARGGHHRRTPGGAGARRQGAGDPAPRRLPAARRGRLHDGRLAGGRRALRGRPASHLGDRRGRLPRRAARRRVGPRRAGGRRSPRTIARGLLGTHAGDRRGRADQPDRLPLEDADQRERQAAVLRAANCPSSTTTSSSAGRARARSGRFAAVFLDDSDAHPRVKERMELTER